MPNHSEHQHHHIKGNRLFVAIILNFTISIFEIIGGLISGSLSLLSDALHNFSDGFAMVLSFLALKLGKKQSNLSKTFGYKRVEIITALFNGLILIAICLFLFKEAIERFISPEKVESKTMLWIAIAGLLINFLSVLLLKKDSQKSLNIKAAYLHLIGDTLSSVAVIIGAILMLLFEIYWIDPIITIMVGVYIIYETVILIKQTIDILMQSAPKDIDILKIKADLEKFEYINNIHHIHVWQMNDHNIHFEAHIDISEDISLSKADLIRKSIELFLKSLYKINHTTIQIEFNSCNDKEILHSITNNH